MQADDARKLAEALGWRISTAQAGYEDGFHTADDKWHAFYSLDTITGAWLVVEAMQERGWAAGVSSNTEDNKWLGEFERPPRRYFAREADTAPAAICAAALAALEASDEQP